MHSTTISTTHEAQRVLASLTDWIMRKVADGRRVRLQAGEEKRTIPQNAHIHPVIREIAKEAGRPLDDESLKHLRLLMLEAWRHETGRQPKFIPSLDGLRWVDVSGGTSDLDKPDCTEFIDWLIAWKATHAQ